MGYTSPCSDFKTTMANGMFQPIHCGLYFTQEHIQQARDQQESEPFRAAWAMLHQRRQVDLLALAQWQGLLYRFDDDAEAGARAVRILQQDDLMPSNPSNHIELVAAALTQAQCFEMVRDHPAFTDSGEWMQQFRGVVSEFNQSSGDWLYSEQVWLNALNLAAGIVLEDESLFAQAVEIFRNIIRHDVHPEGYIRKAAQGQRHESLMRMLLAAQGLILTAEMATHTGEDLWAFNERRVSALTPMPYLLYYYYYPEKWRWDAEIEGDAVPEEGESHIEIEAAQALYKRHAGMWEMAQRQSWSKDRQMLLDSIRPVYDLWGGGLVTLTHGSAEQKRRRFGLF
jgi:hypothetical protein